MTKDTLTARMSEIDAEWDAFVAKHPQGHHEQCSLFGIIRSLYGYRPERVVVRDRGEIRAGAQILVKRTAAGRIATVLRGPLALESSPDAIRSVVDAINSHARRRRYAAVRIELLPTQRNLLVPLESCGFETTSTWFGERVSFVVPLRRSDEALLNGMKKKDRYAVRLAMRQGVKVRMGEDAQITTFVRLHNMTADWKGFPTFPLEYFQYLWSLFAPAGKAQQFIAYHESRPLAGIFNLVVDDMMLYSWAGMDRSPELRPLMANYLLQYTAMKWARDAGCNEYDTCGINPFKKKFGGEPTRWPKPLRRFYGMRGGLHRSIGDFVWSNQLLRRGVERAANQLNIKARHPY